MFEDAAEHIAIHHFARPPSSGAETGGGKAVHVAEAAGSSFVNQCDGVRTEEFAIAASAPKSRSADHPGRAVAASGRARAGRRGRKFKLTSWTISKIHRANELKPHSLAFTRVSRVIRRSRESADVVGLYLNLPDNAIVQRR